MSLSIWDLDYAFFNEAKEIALSIYNVVLLSLVLIPVLVFADMDPSVTLLVSVIGLDAVVVSTMLILFGKKHWVIALQLPGSGEKDNMMSKKSDK